jgi:hypothetical protein
MPTPLKLPNSSVIGPANVSQLATTCGSCTRCGSPETLAAARGYQPLGNLRRREGAGYIGQPARF